MPKKSAAAKRKTAKKTTSAKRGRPASKSTAKKAPAKKTTNVKKPAKKKSSGRGGFNREMNPVTGFVVGTDQDTIATALMEGGESRAAIAEELEGQMDLTTRNGTEKQITNMISGVLNKMKARGYIEESSFIVLPPTTASKRAATRAANQKAATKPKKKAPAKKTAAKRAPAKKTASKKTTAKKTVKKGKAARSRRR